MSVCNTISTVVPSCAPFTNSWMNLHYHNHEWIVNTDHVTAPRYYSDVLTQEVTKEHQKDQMSRALKEKNVKKNNKYIHVPHKDKPPQVVAKRNARERRRVQAVNSAFTRLRKAVPLENNRGKRVSKVKTLQNAIKYIQRLQELLHWHGMYDEYIPNNYFMDSSSDFLENLEENF